MQLTVTKYKDTVYQMQGSKEACRREWEWYQATVKDARCVFEVNGLRCMMCGGGGYAVGKYFDGAHKTHFFERLGNALNFMERFNPESEKSITWGDAALL